jgi:hypothetical protein
MFLPVVDEALEHCGSSLMVESRSPQVDPITWIAPDTLAGQPESRPIALPQSPADSDLLLPSSVHLDGGVYLALADAKRSLATLLPVTDRGTVLKSNDSLPATIGEEAQMQYASLPFR